MRTYVIGGVTLKELSISNNNIGDNGMKIICEELQYNNVLIKLWISSCGLSAEGIANC